MRYLLEYRFVISLAGCGVADLAGLHATPFPSQNVILALIHTQQPAIYAAFSYGYATLWFTTTFLMLTGALSLVYIFAARREGPVRSQPLPRYPAPDTRDDLFVVLGERHRQTSVQRAAAPTWLTIPERGLYTGMLIVGAIGSGKTSACMYPYVDQLLAYRAGDHDKKLGGLILEVKGDFCAHVRDLLAGHGRAEDYIEVSLTSRYRYNPLHNDLDAYALAYGIATLMTNLFGRGKEPFWQQASTNLVKFVILLHKILDDYVTLFQVYEHVISPAKLRTKIAAGDEHFSGRSRRIVVDLGTYASDKALPDATWHRDPTGQRMWTHWSSDLIARLGSKVPHVIEVCALSAADAHRFAQFEAVKRWFDDDWMQIEPKLRTSIVEGVSVFLSLFDDNPRVKHTFCPPKALYDADPTAPTGDDGVALPPLATLIHEGKVIALNFPIAMNPGLARALGTMLKQDFQRAVLNRVHRMHADPSISRRPVVFVCDEYQAFATTGESEPSGDEKFFALARQAKCIPIVATQSISSLRSTLQGESWRTLLQGLRTKIFLALSDDFSARFAADLCGKAERLKPGYTITEAGQDAGVSMLTGRPGAHRTTVSASKTYSLLLDYVFQPKVFAELQNAQAIVLPYDGLNPQPPTYCYLKPHYLNVQTSYFDQVAAGEL